MQIYKTELGETHSEIANTYSDIGSAYRDLGKYNLALDYYNKSLKIRINLFGSENISVAYCYYFMGINCHENY